MVSNLLTAEMKVTVLTMQANRFIAIMDNFNRVQEINNDLMGASGTLAKGYETVLDSVAGKANKARASFEGMWVNAINSDVIGHFYDASYALTTIIDKIGVFNVVITGLIMVLQALYAQSTLVDGKFAQFINTMMIAGEKTKIQATITKFFTETIKEKTMAEIASSVATKTTSVAQDLWNKKATLGATINGLLGKSFTLAVGGASTFIAFLKVAGIEMAKFIALSVAMNIATGGIMAIVGGITSLFTGFSKSVDTATTSVGELNKEIGKHSDNVKSLKNLSDEYDRLTSKMGEARDITKLTSDEQERYNSIMNQVEQIAPNYIAYIGEANTKMVIYGKTLDDIIAKEEELIKVQKEQMIEGQVAISQDVENKEKELVKKQEELKKLLSSLESNAWLDEHGTFNSKSTIDKINKLKSEIQTLGGELESLGAQQVQILESLMSELDDISMASSSMIGLAKERIMEIFEEEGFDKAKASIEDFKIIIEESTMMLTQTGTDFDYTRDASDRLAEAFKRLGYDTDMATSFLTNLAIKLGLVSEGLDEISGKLGYDMEAIEDYQKASESMGQLYDKLVKGNKLATEEMNKIILAYPEIAQYIAETGDLTLQNGELLKQVWEDVNESMMSHFNETVKNNQDVIKGIEIEIKAKEKQLELYEKEGKTATKIYKDIKNDVDNLKNSLESKREEVAKNVVELEALKQASSGKAGEMSLDVSLAGFQDAQKKLESYYNILAEIDDKGKLASETNRRIIAEHGELAHVIGQEAEMRELIKEKIKETEEVAINYYSNVLKHNSEFYQKMLSSNSDLFNKIADTYGINFQNFKDMNDAMLAVAVATSQKIAQAMSLRVSMGGSTSITTSEGSAREDIRKQTDEINRLKAIANSGSVASIMKETGGGGRIDLQNQIKILEQALQGSKAGADTLADQKKIQDEIDSMFKIEAKSALPNINTSSGSYKPSKVGGGGGGGGKSDPSAPRPVDPIDITKNVNAYRRWEEAIKRVDEALERHRVVQDRAIGQDWVHMMEKENTLLKEKQKLLANTNTERRREKDILDKRLKKWGVDTNSPTQGASDFERLIMSRQNQLNTLTNQINAITSDTQQRKDLIERRDELKDGIQSLIDDYERFVDVLNEVEETSIEWWNVQSQILDNQLKRIDEGLRKYEDALGMIDQRISLLGKIRDTRPVELQKELDLLDEIIEVQRSARGSLNQPLYESNQKIKQYEQQLKAMGDIRNDHFKTIQNALITEREYNKKLMDEFFKYTLDLNNAMENATNKRIEALQRERDEIFKNIDAIMEMAYVYEYRTIFVDERDIQHQIDLLNKKFRDDADVRLDTSGIQSDLNNIRGYFDSLKETYDELKDSIDIPKEDVEKVSKLEQALYDIKQSGLTDDIKEMFGIVGDSIEDATKQLEEMLKSEKHSKEQNQEKADLLEEIMKKQANLIKQNEEEAKKLKEEIEDLAYEYKEIEASLQNRINLKEEELKLLQEQFRREEKVRSQIEKQLELLRALDDTRYSYISGTGEEVFTYDVSAVNKLRKELDKMQRQDKQEKQVQDLQEEIKKMKEELQRTQEINKLDIAIRELQLKALEQNTEAMKDLLGQTKEEFSDVYDNLADNLVDEFKKAMEAMVGTHEKLWREYLARNSFTPTPDSFTHQKGNEYYEQRNYSAKKGETAQSIADKHGIKLQDLLDLNPQLANEKEALSKDYNLKIPVKDSWKFDTGGYTGDFSGGKLAMLHEKELVLNKADTANMLEMLNITRSMVKELSGKNNTNFDLKTKKDESGKVINIENVNLPSVKDGKSFVNELYGFFRKGQNRLV